MCHQSRHGAGVARSGSSIVIPVRVRNSDGLLLWDCLLLPSSPAASLSPCLSTGFALGTLWSQLRASISVPPSSSGEGVWPQCSPSCHQRAKSWLQAHLCSGEPQPGEVRGEHLAYLGHHGMGRGWQRALPWLGCGCSLWLRARQEEEMCRALQAAPPACQACSFVTCKNSAGLRHHGCWGVTGKLTWCCRIVYSFQPSAAISPLWGQTPGGAQPTEEGLFSPEMPLAGHRQPRSAVGMQAESP